MELKGLAGEFSNKDLSDNSQWQVVLKQLLLKLELVQNLLEEYEKMHHIFFSLSDDMMFIYNNEFEIIHVSPNVERILGYKPEEFIGKNLQMLDVIDPEEQEEVLDHAQHMFSDGIVTSSIYEHITKCGDNKFIEVSGIPYKRYGRIEEILVVGKDITDWVRLRRTKEYP